MFYRNLLLLVLILSACSNQELARIEIQKGSIVGLEEDGVRQFFGLPYAAPPINNLRWAPPQMPNSWQGVFDAREFGPWCPQPDHQRKSEGITKSGPGYTLFIDVPPVKNAQEDCLNLNVWSPVGARNLPVVVFIHGNALGNSFPLYKGQAFAKSGVIYVSINYRLLTIGNFAHPALTAAAPQDQPLGRYSTLDQLAALKWVQENIGFFGGDSKRVTVMGQSAGGAAILQMLAMPEAEGLFQQAIVQSGNGWWSPIEQKKHEQFGCKIAELSGLNGCDATAEELRSIPWQDIVSTGPYSIDGRLWKQGATQVTENGGSLKIPLLIGFNSHDGNSLRYSPQALFDRTAAEVLAAYAELELANDDELAMAIYTDQRTAAPARWIAKNRYPAAPTWLYRFSYVLNLAREDGAGAEHAMELPYIFDTWAEGIEYTIPLAKWLPFSLENFVLNDDDREMTRIMHSCWVSFIKTGKPHCAGVPDWPPWDADNNQLMDLGSEISLIKNYRNHQLNTQEATLTTQLKEQQQGYDDVIAGTGGEY